jgi:hypothetical protein
LRIRFLDGQATVSLGAGDSVRWTRCIFSATRASAKGPRSLARPSRIHRSSLLVGALAAAAVTKVAMLHDTFRCRPLQGVALLCWLLKWSPRGTVGSRRFHPSRKSGYRTDCSTLVTMGAHSTRPLPSPKFSSAVATAPPAPPPVLPLLYSDVVWCQTMAVTTAVGNLNGSTLAATIAARERNHSRAISRNHAPATICNGLHGYAPDCDVK